MGAAGPRTRRDARPVHRHAGRLSGAGPGEPPVRHPHDRRPVHAGRQVLHDAALRPSGRRSGGLPAEGQRAWSTSRCRCRSTTSASWAAPSSSPGSSARATGARCRGSAATADGPACRCETVLDRAGVKAAGARVRVLRRRPRPGRGRVPDPEVHRRTTVRPEPDARAGAVARPFLAWALNGEPLTRHQGSPLRLLVPGWYGVANVKWLAQIHAQEEAYLGKFQARWYRTLQGRDDRRRDEVEGDRHHADAAEVVHRARDARRQATRCSASC